MVINATHHLVTSHTISLLACHLKSLLEVMPSCNPLIEQVNKLDLYMNADASKMLVLDHN